MYDNTHFSNAIKYWYMGKLYDWHETQLHPMTFALHYGGSVFEGIRVYRTPTGPAIFRLSEHIDRLIHSASIAHMEVTYNRKEIIHAIKTTLKENHLESAYIRPLLFYSYLTEIWGSPRSIAPSNCRSVRGNGTPILATRPNREPPSIFSPGEESIAASWI